jgi:predicted nuclease of restriction endonuclease-like RecB superfamily
MLTKDLLQTTVRGDTIEPRFRDPAEHRDLAATVIDAYEPGRKRAAIDATVADLETHETFKFVRGLSKLLGRRSTFETDAPKPPRALRRAVFERGYVTDDDERAAVLAAVADDVGLSSEAVAANLWADRADEQVLVDAPTIDQERLVREYNLSLAQTLLFDASECTVAVEDGYQRLFRTIGGLGLLYDVAPDLQITVTGPAAMGRKTRKYGTQLAKLLPAVVAAEGWSLTASIETEVGGDERTCTFALDDGDAGLFPDTTVESADYDSAIERDFAARIASLADGWDVTREPTILRAGETVMIPDFGFERGAHDLYLEIVGFWTPEYLQEKIEKVRVVESEAPLLLAVNERLNCTEDDFAGADEVFFYDPDRKVPVKPVLDRLRAIDDRETAADRERLAEREVTLPTAITPVADIAADHDVATAAMADYLADTPGLVSNGQYVPAAEMDRLREEIATLEEVTLDVATDVLTDAGLDQTVLEALGYEIRYTSLDQSEATLRSPDD